MLLEVLEHVLRIEAWIGVVEANDETKRDDVVFRAVDPGAAVFLHGERPAHRIDDLTYRDPARRNFPKLLHADTISLRIAALREIEFVDEFFGQRAARAFGEDRDLGSESVTGFEV